MVVEYQNCFDTMKFSKSFAKTGLFNNPAVAACEARIETMQYEKEQLKSKLDRKQNEINQIDEILNELFGVTHDVVKTPDEFGKILKEKIGGYKTISDFFPTEPIEVASMLINSGGEYERSGITKMIYGEGKETYNLFDISELKQIAQHLLVYCEANESEGEE